jgi:hypothetical protein
VNSAVVTDLAMRAEIECCAREDDAWAQSKHAADDWAKLAPKPASQAAE